jgi:hypothetical protein
MINYSQNNLLNTSQDIPIANMHEADRPPPEPPPFLANTMTAHLPHSHTRSLTPPPVHTATKRPPPESPPDSYTTPMVANTHLLRKQPDSNISPERISRPKRLHIQTSPGSPTPNSSSKIQPFPSINSHHPHLNNKRKHKIIEQTGKKPNNKKQKCSNSPTTITAPITNQPTLTLTLTSSTTQLLVFSVVAFRCLPR